MVGAITKRQKQVLDFIADFHVSRGYNPPLREIKDYFGLASESTIHQHIRALEQKGYIDKFKNVLEPQKIEAQLNLIEYKVTETVKSARQEVSNILTRKKIENQLFNADCISLMKRIEDESVDLIFADPPYNLSKSNFKMKFYKSGGSDLSTHKGSWDNIPKDQYEDFTNKWIREAYRITKPGGAIWVAGSYHNIYLTGYLLEKHGFELLNEVLWHKTDATPNLSCTRFVADHENFIWARKGKGNVFNYELMKDMNGGKQMRSIWPKGKTTGGKKLHPTQKPEWLVERIILASSHKASLVLDPFLGSGTTAVVAKRLGRLYTGIELDKEYFDIARHRIKEAGYV